ncbi:prepilin-type N-terminal cleavage/methylation domain-containing protein [bacterium]|nr:prepilin-type N-terminal cleavage/methylation domain-containing protein [bacterium]
MNAKWFGEGLRLQKAPGAGFTLMEIMLVVIIIGILATLVVANLGGMTTTARITKAQADIAQFRTQLGLFEQLYGRYPTEQGVSLICVHRGLNLT